MEPEGSGLSSFDGPSKDDAAGAASLEPPPLDAKRQRVPPQQVTEIEELALVANLDEQLSKLGGSLGGVKGRPLRQLCVEALSELLASSVPDKGAIVLEYLNEVEGVACKVPTFPSLLYVAAEHAPFEGFRAVWEKLLELNQDPDLKYQGVSPREKLQQKQPLTIEGALGL